MRGATGITLQPHQILRLPRKIALQNQRKICRKQLKRHCAADSSMIRPWSEHDPTMKLQNWTRPFAELTFPPSATHFVLKITTFRAPAIYPDFTEYCACHKKWRSKITKYCACHATWLSWLMSVTHNTSFTMRAATSITLQPHQMLPLPRKMMRIIDCRRIWNVIYNARSNRHHPPTSPNTAPATQNCTPKSKKNLPKTVEASFPMRGRFEHDPTMIRTWSDHEIAKLNPSVRRAYFSPLGNAFCIENYNISRSGYLPRFHRILRLPQKVTLQDHQILRLPRNMTLMIDVRHPWHVIYNARSNKHHPPTSPNAAPATKNDAHHWLSSHMKRHLQCAEPQASPSNLTKYCACHAKWLIENYNISRSGYLLKFHRILRLPRKVTLQPHQMLLLPRKMMRIIDCRRIWNVIYNAQSNRHHPPTSPNTAPATQKCTPKSKRNSPRTVEAPIPMRGRFDHDPNMIRPWSDHDPSMNSSSRTRPFVEVTFRASETHFVLKITTFRAPAIYSNFTEYCACHEKWPSNLTKCCSCHEKWCASLIVVAYETSFTMRRATGITLQPHQILRLPRKSALQNLSEILRERLKRQFQCAADSTMIRTWSEHDPTMIRPWSEHELVISHPPVRRGYFSRFGDHFVLKITTFRAPAIYSNFTEYCACHEKWPSNLTKCCSCHEKGCASLIVIAYETSFTMRRATGITLQPHQILRLPRKSALQNLSEILRERLKRQFQCAADSTMIRTWSEHDPTMIRPWSEHELVISHPPVRRGYFSRFGDAFCIENYNISRSGYLLKFHRILRLPRKVTLRHHQILRLPRKMTLRHHQMLRLPRKVTLRHHQILRLPRKVRLLLNCYWTELLLSCYWAVTKLLLSCYWTVTELNCYWTVTQLLLNWPVTQLLLDCYWTVTELTCYWPVTELSCYSAVTELLLCTATWTVTVLDSLHF